MPHKLAVDREERMDKSVKLNKAQRIPVTKGDNGDAEERGETVQGQDAVLIHLEGIQCQRNNRERRKIDREEPTRDTTAINNTNQLYFDCRKAKPCLVM